MESAQDMKLLNGDRWLQFVIGKLVPVVLALLIAVGGALMVMWADVRQNSEGRKGAEQHRSDRKIHETPEMKTLRGNKLLIEHYDRKVEPKLDKLRDELLQAIKDNK